MADSIHINTYKNGVRISTNNADLQLHPSEALEVFKMLMRYFILRGTISEASLDALYQTEKEAAQEEPLLKRCPYCQHYHEPQLIELCPLKPKHTHDILQP